MKRPSASPPAGFTGGAHFGRYIVIGFLTVAPLWVTWLVANLVFGFLANAGFPLLRGVALALRPFSETLADWLLNPVLQYMFAIVLTLAGLYAIGLLTALVLAQRLIAFMERQLQRLPFVHTIYGATKRLVSTFQQPPVSTQRVVLIAFPSPEMKAIGLVTRVMHDPTTGRKLAAVYVPTSPNPTSGYIEIVPLDDVVQTDWTVEEAMSFVMTGGTNARDELTFANPPAAKPSRPC